MDCHVHYSKGGIDGPAGAANAGALPGAPAQRRTTFASVISSTPPTLLSRCGNPDVEHAHYYSSLHSAIKRRVWKTITEVTLKYNLYVSIVYYSYVLNNFVLIIITQVINLCRITFITSVPPLYSAA